MFSKKLKQCRKAMGLTQTELASKLLVGNKTISDYERGISSPDLDTIKKFALFFNVTVDYLLDESSKEPIVPATNEDSPTLIALHNQAEALSDEQLKQVITYVEFLKSQD